MKKGSDIDASWLYLKIYPESSEEIGQILLSLRSLSLYELKNLFTQFFYVRYHDPDPHIRVRFKVLSSQKTILSTRTREAIENELVGLGISGFHVLEDLYQPETLRYGGEILMAICEQQFIISSMLCLDICTDRETKSYSSRMGIAFHMHYNLLECYNIDHRRKIELLDRIEESWLNMFCMKSSIGNNLELKLEIKKRFESRITPELLCELSNNLKDKQKDGFLKISFARWKDDNMAIARSIQYLSAKEFNSKQYLREITTKAHLDEDKRVVYTIVESFIHMTNNRLGIINLDEAYQASILSKIYSLGLI